VILNAVRASGVKEKIVQDKAVRVLAQPVIVLLGREGRESSESAYGVREC
jgi:hypothetical protein